MLGAVPGITVNALVDATGVLTGTVEVEDSVKPGSYVVELHDDTGNKATCSIEITASPKPTLNPIAPVTIGGTGSVSGINFEAGSYTGDCEVK
ncbi:hypothetical protein GZL_01397 [Streptomyces sp. 769]|nr:hypothetical protein GZL_01397 [Streptomyces sp. 769]